MLKLDLGGIISNARVVLAEGERGGGAEVGLTPFPIQHTCMHI